MAGEGPEATEPLPGPLWFRGMRRLPADGRSAAGDAWYLVALPRRRRPPVYRGPAATRAGFGPAVAADAPMGHVQVPSLRRWPSDARRSVGGHIAEHDPVGLPPVGIGRWPGSPDPGGAGTTAPGSRSKANVPAAGRRRPAGRVAGVTAGTRPPRPQVQARPPPQVQAAAARGAGRTPPEVQAAGACRRAAPRRSRGAQPRRAYQRIGGRRPGWWSASNRVSSGISLWAAPVAREPGRLGPRAERAADDGLLDRARTSAGCARSPSRSRCRGAGCPGRRPRA